MHVEFEGCLLHYDDRGEGPAIVFSHGAGADRAMFEEQAEFLSVNGYRVITWDLRQHGASRPSARPVTPSQLLADLRALLEHLGIERPVLAGQSLGGNLSQAVIRSTPGIARGLVVMDSAWNTGPLSWAERALVKTAAPSLAVIPASRLPKFMADASASTPAGRRYAEAAFTRMPKADFIEVWRTTVDLLDPDPDYRTPVPLLLVRGELDRTGNISSAMPRWAEAEGVTEVVVPGAGHLVTVDAPEAMNELLLDFLRALP